MSHDVQNNFIGRWRALSCVAPIALIFQRLCAPPVHILEAGGAA
jgi:hypothetical protein